MELQDERSQLRTVAQRWRKAYSMSPWAADADKQDIGKALAALDAETATAEDVARIIGNRTWVGPKTCHECGAETWATVEVGQEDCETATVCADCLRAALRLLGAA